MKNNIRKTFLTVAALSIAFSSIPKVSAATVSETIGGTQYTASTKYSSEATQASRKSRDNKIKGSDIGVTFKTGGTVVKDNGHFSRYSNAYASDLFCLDANLTSSRDEGKKLYVSRISGYDNKTLEKVSTDSVSYAHDLAISSIMKAYEASSKSDADYFSATLAIRTVSMTFFGVKSGTEYGGGQALEGAMQHLTALWTMGGAGKENYDKLKGSFSSMGSGIKSGGNELSGAPVDKAHSWYNDALKAAADHIGVVGSSSSSDGSITSSGKMEVTTSRNELVSSSKKESSSGDASSSSGENSGVTSYAGRILKDTSTILAINENPEGGTGESGTDAGTGETEKPKITEPVEVTKTVVQNFDFKNINKDNEPTFTLNGFKFKSDPKEQGFKDSKIDFIKVNGTDVCSGDCSSYLTKNLLEGIDSTDVNIQIGIKVSGNTAVPEGSTEATLKCGKPKLEFELDYTYGNKGDKVNTRSEYENNIFNVWKFKNGGDNYQRYISYAGEGDRSSGTSETPDYNTDKIEDEVALDSECDCEILKTECETANDFGTPGGKCETFKEKCPDCETLEYFCDKEGEGSQSCKDLEEKDECADCEDLAEKCQKSGSATSTECEKYNRLCEEDCIKWGILKDLGDAEAKRKYEEKPCEDQPQKCLTDIPEDPDCCDSSGKLLVDPMFKYDGTFSSEGEEPVEIHGNKKDEIKKCFVTMPEKGMYPVDDKDNKYAMETDPKVSGNKFCKVNCREDYAMDYPIAKRSNAGRYFTFHMNMESHKQCYTSKIDRKTYIELITSYLETIKESFNVYQEYKRAWDVAHEHPAPDHATYKCSGCSVEKDKDVPVSEDGGETGDYPYITMDYEIIEDRGELKTEPKYTTVNGNKEAHADMFGEESCGCCEDDEGNCTNPKAGPTNYTPKTLEQWKAELAEVWIAAEQRNKNAIQLLKQTIIEYNNCVEWNANYNPAPEVKYDYDELDYRDMAGMPTDMQGDYAVTGEEYSHCTQEWTKDITVDVDNTYESCQGGSGFGADSKENLLYIEDCNLEGANCTTYTPPITKSIFRKSNSDAKGTYFPPLTFYNIFPSGNITVNKGEGKTTELITDDGKGLLPVQLSTKMGDYNYYIFTSNIGEYYDTGNQGRFAGNGNPIIGVNFEFVCQYLVNIPDAPDQTIMCDGPGTEDKHPNCGPDDYGYWWDSNNKKGSTPGDKSVYLADPKCNPPEKDDPSCSQDEEGYWWDSNGNKSKDKTEYYDKDPNCNKTTGDDPSCGKDEEGYWWDSKGNKSKDKTEYYDKDPKCNGGGDKHPSCGVDKNGYWWDSKGNKSKSKSEYYEKDPVCNPPDIPKKLCPECDLTCIGSGCPDICLGDDCVADCVGVGCIYDVDAGTSLVQKQVSLNNVFPNGTDAYNWTDEKGKQALQEIEEKGNSIYDTKPLLSITITPSASRAIREYNRSVEDEGGYSNDTITCDPMWPGDNERGACLSKFIDDVVSGRYGTLNESYIKEGIRNNRDNYFQIWPGYAGKDESVKMGPAWKAKVS